MPDSNTFISPAELASQLGSSDISVVDASWYLPTEGRDPKAEFLASRIPGAQFFDIDTVADLDHACPHMLPSEPVFTDCVQALGIGANSRVVVYDGKGLFSAARAWWMFRVFGHDRVQILQGGLPGWNAAGYETEQGEPTVAAPGVGFVATHQSAWVTDAEGVKAALSSGSHIVVDARVAFVLGVEQRPEREHHEEHDEDRAPDDREEHARHPEQPHVEVAADEGQDQPGNGAGHARDDEVRQQLLEPLEDRARAFFERVVGELRLTGSEALRDELRGAVPHVDATPGPRRPRGVVEGVADRLRRRAGGSARGDG